MQDMSNSLIPGTVFVDVYLFIYLSFIYLYFSFYICIYFSFETVMQCFMVKIPSREFLFFINYSHFDNDSYTLMVSLTQEMEDQTKLSFYGLSSQFPLP